MADVKWIKISTYMFDNRKIKHLRRLPDGDNIVLIWVMLLTIAGRCNANGRVFLTEDIPYTSKMLAEELNFEEGTIQLALSSMEELGMIVNDNDFLYITGWEEHQNVEGMDKIREQNRLRKQRQREREKELNCDGNVMSRDSHAIEEDKNKIKKFHRWHCVSVFPMCQRTDWKSISDHVLTMRCGELMRLLCFRLV